MAYLEQCCYGEGCYATVSIRYKIFQIHIARGHCFRMEHGDLGMGQNRTGIEIPSNNTHNIIYTLFSVFTAAKRTVGLADVKNICKTDQKTEIIIMNLMKERVNCYLLSPDTAGCNSLAVMFFK